MAALDGGQVNNGGDGTGRTRAKLFDADIPIESDDSVGQTSMSWPEGRRVEPAVRDSNSTSDLGLCHLEASRKLAEDVEYISTTSSVWEESVKSYCTFRAHSSRPIRTMVNHGKRRAMETRLKGFTRRSSDTRGVVGEESWNDHGESERLQFEGKSGSSETSLSSKEGENSEHSKDNPLDNPWIEKFCESYYTFVTYFILYNPETSPFWPPNDFFPLLTNNQMIDLGLGLLSEIQRRKNIQAAGFQLRLPEITDYDARTRVPIRILCRLSDERFHHLCMGFCSEFKRTNESRIRANIVKFYPKLISLTSEKALSLDCVDAQSVKEAEQSTNSVYIHNSSTRLRTSVRARDSLQNSMEESCSLSVRSDQSKQSSDATFVTANSSQTSMSFHTASARTSLQSARPTSIVTKKSNYTIFLHSLGLLPLNPFNEKNWSGRGQHVEFQLNEKHQLRRILQVDSVLGTTANALVESVKCRRIFLARKTVRCGRRISRETAIKEVAHLQRLGHSHIVQVIGTYVMGNDFAILLYPVAEFNLETFIQSIIDPSSQDNLGGHHQSITKADEEETKLRSQSLAGFFKCLANALKYIHGKITKHMDIKPKNILVRDVRTSPFAHTTAYKIYVADFGIARAYPSQEESETEGPTLFTRKYAAPEVVNWDRRGLTADIFSLGCVFVEMLAALAPRDPVDQTKELESIRLSNENDSSYQANIQHVQEWLFNLSSDQPLYFPVALLSPLVSEMLSSNPAERPSAQHVACCLGASERCCTETVDPEPLEAAKEENHAMRGVSHSIAKGTFGRVLAMIKESR